MKKIANLCVKIGTYERDGETKNRYITVGSKMENDKGVFFLLNRTFSPAGVPNPDGRDSIILSIFPVKEEGTKQVNDPQEIVFTE